MRKPKSKRTWILEISLVERGVVSVSSGGTFSELIGVEVTGGLVRLLDPLRDDLFLTNESVLVISWIWRGREGRLAKRYMMKIIQV